MRSTVSSDRYHDLTTRAMKVTAQTPSAFSIDTSIQMLNSDCFCISLDTDALRAALESEIDQPGLFNLVQQRCPYLFAGRPVFLSHEHMTPRSITE